MSQLPPSTGSRLPRLVLLVLAALAVLAPAGAQAARSSVELSAPRGIRVGHSASVRLDALRAGSLGAFEAVVRYDHSRAEIAAVRARRNGVSARGRRVEPLGPITIGRRDTFGFYSCAPALCGAAGKGIKARKGRRRLATLELRGKRPGKLRITLIRATRANDDGIGLASTRRSRSLTIRVVKKSRRAPRGRKATRAPFSRKRTARATRSLDVSGDGVVNRSDAAAMALTWVTAQTHGARCVATAIGAADVNGDGCLDVTDLQLVAAHFANATPPGGGGGGGGTPPPVGTLVNSTADGSDAKIDGKCATASGVCTLRAAIQEANAHAGADRIGFRIPGSGVHAIKLFSALPPLNDARGATTIDGYTQPGAAPNNAAVASNARLMIEVVGGGPNAYDCVTVLSAGNVVRGLAMYNCHRTVLLFGAGARANSIQGDYIGTNAAGTFGASKVEQAGAGIGVELNQGASQNHIGEATLGGRNVISGNATTGIDFFAEGTNGNRMLNNIIGLSPAGDRQLRNFDHGIDINSGASNNVVGGTGARQRNVLSGNGSNTIRTNFTAGVEISHSTTTTGNRVSGNFFGTNLTGTAAPSYAANGHYAIRLEDGVNDIDIDHNVIANSKDGGIRADSDGTRNVRITDNLIGISPAGAAMPNAFFGIQITLGAKNFRVARNVIAHNPVGIQVLQPGTDFITMSRNSIFANTGVGIDLVNSANGNIARPVVNATTSTASGTSCSGCTVEVFQSDNDPSSFGEGQRFLGSGTAGSDGRFRFAVSGLKRGMTVTATATDKVGNTSEFAHNVPVR